MNLSIWQFLAGVALFIYAMRLVENSLKHLAGRPFKKFLQKHSRSKFKMIVSSTVVTALLQSSSLVILMVLSFVGAGLLKTPDALAASLGCNVGTTFGNWIIAWIGFKVSIYQICFPILSVSLIGLLFARKKTIFWYITSFLIGFSFLFVGLEWMKESVNDTLLNSFENLRSRHYLIMFPIGFVLTSIIQSSSASVAIILTALNSGMIPFEHAASMVLGSELGTTIKFLLGSVGGTADKKRVAWGNFFMNLITMLVVLALLWPLIYLVQDVIQIKDPVAGLVVFQTSVNFISIVLFLPFLNVFSRWLERMIKTGDGKGLTKYIYLQQPSNTGDALEMAEKEIEYLLEEAIAMNKEIIGIKEENKKYSRGIFMSPVIGAFDEKYDKIKILQGEIIEYLSTVRKENMDEREIHRSGELINTVRHILRAGKNMKDIRHNLEEFSSSANDELYNEYKELQRGAAKFYADFTQNLNGNKPNSKIIQQLMDENLKEYDDSVAGLLKLTSKSEISNLESTNLLNVYREIYSSNKALILSLAELEGIDV